jgi:hypothetical protein
MKSSSTHPQPSHTPSKPQLNTPSNTTITTQQLPDQTTFSTVTLQPQSQTKPQKIKQTQSQNSHTSQPTHKKTTPQNRNKPAKTKTNTQLMTTLTPNKKQNKPRLPSADE